MKQKHTLGLRSLLAAAALLAGAPAQAYNFGGWSGSGNINYDYGYTEAGNNNYFGIDYDINQSFTPSQRAAIRAGVYSQLTAWINYGNNDQSLGPVNEYADSSRMYAGYAYWGDGDHGRSYSGTFNYNYYNPVLAADTGFSIHTHLWGFDSLITGGNGPWAHGYAVLTDRGVQVGYVQNNGWNWIASDNTVSLDSGLGGAYASYGALNVLPTARNNANTAWLGGSVVSVTGIHAVNGQGLYAKDGGWLDIRGNLVVDSGAGLFIRHGEITSNIYYGRNLDLNEFSSGILSVRNTFAQDMYVQGSQTIGLRDGAVNAANVYIQGSGYSAGAGYFGAIRSITGTNTQNGLIGIGWVGGAGNYGTISAEVGSTFVINGGVNGVVGLGGSNLYYNVGGQVVQNGHIGGFIADVTKVSGGDLRLASSNSFTGDLFVQDGTVTAAHSQALASGGATYVDSGASLVLDGTAANLGISENVYLAGNGFTGTPAALYNLAGANGLTGAVTLRSNSSIATAAGSSLTVTGNLETEFGNLYGLDITTSGSGASASSLTVTGHTGNIFHINKYGAGTATIGTADADLLSVNVEAGKLVLSDSSSSAGSPFGVFDKYGAGILELGGVHRFSGYNANAGATTVAGTLRSNVVAIDAATVNVISGGVLNGNVSLSDTAAATVVAGGVLNGDVTLVDHATVTVSGTSVGTPAVVTHGVINGNITASNDAVITLGSYGVINGDVTIYDNARFIIEANSIHNGDFNASVDSHITIDGHLTDTGAFSSNFLVSGNTRLDGHGIIDGNVLQTGGVVAPGNSPGILTVGSYTNNGGVLDLEIANNTGAAGVGYDQLRSDGVITVSNTLPANYSTIRFTDYALGAAPAYEGARRDVFQVIATSTGASRNTFDKFDLAEYTTGANDRMLFDHSTGRVYGTGLTLGTGTFRDYGVTINQKEIGRALWMESIAYDKHTSFTDENFASTALDPVAAAAQRGYKAWILTSHDAVLGEQATDLGLGAVSVLIAPDATLALDALSPEAYVGLADQGARIARGFARLPFSARSVATVAGWDFDVGYLNDELRSDSSSAYTSYKAASNQYNVSASRALGERVRFTVGVGYDDGRISAEGFRADVNTIGLGAGLVFTPYSKNWSLSVGAGITTADWKAERGASLAKADGEQALSFAGRFALAPLTKGDFSFTPYLGVAYARSRIDGFAETDVPGSIQLAVDGFSHQSLQSELGTSIDYRIKPTTFLSAVFAWEHEFRGNGATTITSQFVEAGVTDTKFNVRANGFGSDLFRAGLSFRHDLTPQSSIRLGYDAILGSAVSSGRQIHADYSVRF